MTTTRRRGSTLMEVLIAIVILGIGLLAIMTLFPIGAVNMARAISQDRSTTHGVNSDSVFRVYWKQAWNDPATGATRISNDEAYGYSQEPMLFLLDKHVTYGIIPANSSQPGFPVLVDPIGWQTNPAGSLNQYYVAGSPVLPMRTTLRRCININNGYVLPWAQTFPPTPVPLPPPIIVNPPNPLQVGLPYPSIQPPGPVIRLTTMLDEFTYDAAGEPAADGGQLQRGGRYNVAWLIQRSRTDVPSEVNVNVLVFAGRSPTDKPSAEIPFRADTAPGSKQITVYLGVGQAPPPLRKGGWIAWSMQVTPQNGVRYPSLDFYRVVGVNDEVPNQLSVEIEAPIKSYAGAMYTNQAVVVFDDLFEVFERGSVAPSSVADR